MTTKTFVLLISLSLLLPSNTVIVHPKQLLDEDQILLAVNFGTPFQQFRLILDTSSSFTWIPSVTAANSEASDAKFDPKKSTSFKYTNKLLSISNAYGDVSGSTVTDTLGYTNLKLDNFNFVLVDKISNDYEDSFNGKIGLAFSNFVSDDYLLIKHLTNNKKLPNSIFSFVYDNQKKIMNFDAGFLPDNYKPEDYSSCNVVGGKDFPEDFANSWNCSLSHIIVGSIDAENLVEVNGFASFDSGSSFVIAPESYAPLFLENLGEGCRLNDSGSMKYILCPKGAEGVDVSLVIENKSYTLQADQLLSPFDSNLNLFGVTFQNDYIGAWIVGRKFMNNFATIYDYERSKVRIKGNVNDVKELLESEETEQVTLDRETQRLYLIFALGAIGSIVLLVILFLCCKHSREKKLIDEEMHDN